MMECIQGAQDINNFRQKIEQVYNTDNINFDDLTHVGLFNEHFFKYSKIEEKDDLALDVSVAKSLNPISEEIEYFVNVGLISKYDGDGIKKFGRPKAKIVILLDISGSMSGEKLNTAKHCLVELLDQLDSKDHLAIVLFDDKAEVLQTLQLVSEINFNQLKQQISSIKTRGGTDFSQGLIQSYNILKQSKNEIGVDYEKRVFILTDAEPNIGIQDGGGLYKIFSEAAQKKIYSTFFGLGLDFNTQIVETISKAQGCTYYTVMDMGEFKKILVEDFNYMVFPAAFDIEISSSIEYTNVYGSPNTDENNSGSLASILSAMPSNSDQAKGTKGGIILLKINKIPENNLNQATLNLKYKKRNGELQEQTYIIPFDKLINNAEQQYQDTNQQQEQQQQQAFQDYYQDFAIRKGILLTREINLLKELFKQEDNYQQLSYAKQQNNQEDQDEQKKNLKFNLNDVRKQKLEKFLQVLNDEKVIMNDISLDKEIKLIQQLVDKEQEQQKKKILKKKR